MSMATMSTTSIASAISGPPRTRQKPDLATAQAGVELSSAIQGGAHKGGMTAALRERIANDLNPLDPMYEPRPDNEKLDAKPEAHAPAHHDAHGAHH